MKDKITMLYLGIIAKQEAVSIDFLLERIKDGRIVIPHNKNRKLLKPCGIGEGLRTKVNVNIGTSPDLIDISLELKKLKIAVQFGADTVMDLSTGGDLKKIRRVLLKECPIPFGTVPIYQVAVEASKKRKDISKMKAADIFEILEEKAEDGVDFWTIHAGINLDSLKRLRNQDRITSVVSRGGTLTIEWMVRNKKENPLYEYFDRVIEIAKRYNITLSLGDGLRPGSISDATDRPQIQELITLGELTNKAGQSGVAVMIEGPGHVPLNQIESNVVLEKKLCNRAPFYVLGPLVTDVAPGYDHITSAIGGALAAFYGADFLCYVTPSEHLRIPSLEDVKEGLIASRIAAHSADVAKGISSAIDWDKRFSEFRKERNWKAQIKNALDPTRPAEYRESIKSSFDDVCSMCGKYCSMKSMEELLKRVLKNPY